MSDYKDFLLYGSLESSDSDDSDYRYSQDSSSQDSSQDSISSQDSSSQDSGQDLVDEETLLKLNYNYNIYGI